MVLDDFQWIGNPWTGILTNERNIALGVDQVVPPRQLDHSTADRRFLSKTEKANAPAFQCQEIVRVNVVQRRPKPLKLFWSIA